jgi:sulfur transporter
MAMIFPFESLSAESRQAGLVAGTLIGFGFGFTLERAGFGRAPKLAAQFYGTDLTVLKVMFGAIVTAMLGMVVLSGLGGVDFKAVADQAASATFLWPMIAGGFALGVGFIVSGYCPGTSFVAAASGKLDGLAVVGGVIVGQVAYGELEWRPLLSRFHNSGNLGHLYLWELIKLPASFGPAVVATAVVAMAVGAFLVAEKLEKRFAARADPVARPGAAGPPGRAVFAGFAAAAVAGIAALALPARSDAHSREAPRMTPLELARRVLDQPWRVRVLDLRSREACSASRVPGAECVPADKLPALHLEYASAARDLVLVGEADLAALPTSVIAFPGRVYLLQGGFQRWQEFALTAPPPVPPGASPSDRDRYRLRAGIHAAMTGMKAAPPPPVPTGAAPAAPAKGGGGCGG